MAASWNDIKMPIHLKEMSGTLFGLKHFLRSQKSRNTFSLFLTDNLGDALAVEKGRAGNPRLLYFLRI
eukprot:6859145-Karenia_brevis.AAC.1